MTAPSADAGGDSAAIDVAELRKAYGGRAVLHGLSFEVRRGEVFALLGPNGAGKTTTVEIIEGYRRPDGGSIRVLGIDPAHARRDDRARIGLMLQGGGGIDPRLSAREVVSLYARFHARPRDVDEVLGAVGLAGPATRTRYRRLSGGERQRVGLALAIVGRPAIAILDEPTAGLDVEGRALVRDLIATLRADDTTVVLTSHDLADVERIADRIAILDRGRIVALGSAADLVAGAASVIRLRLATALSAADEAAFAAVAGGPLTDDGGPGRYRLDGVPTTPGILAAIAAWCSERGVLIVELRTGGGSLEDRYLELVGRSEDAA